MMTTDRATCIVFSDDDLPLEGLDHTRPLYIIVGCSAIEFHPYCYCPWLCTFRLWSLHTNGHGYLDDRVVDWSNYIPYTILGFEDSHFIYDRQVITVHSPRDMCASSEPMLQINHSDDDLFFTRSMVVLDMMRDGVDEFQHQFHHLQLGDETFDVPVSVMIVPSSPDRASFLSLCFPDETTNYGIVIEPLR
ncbi:hypothetical protein AAG906_005623 [Vitis piasezkii]